MHRPSYKFENYNLNDFVIHYIWGDLCEDIDSGDYDSWLKMAMWLDLLYEDL